MGLLFKTWAKFWLGPGAFLSSLTQEKHSFTQVKLSQVMIYVLQVAKPCPRQGFISNPWKDLTMKSTQIPTTSLLLNLKFDKYTVQIYMFLANKRKTGTLSFNCSSSWNYTLMGLFGARKGKINPWTPPIWPMNLINGLATFNAGLLF